MDKAISNIAAMGIPGLILIIAIEATGYTGAAAITTALAGLGPGGIVGGVGVLLAVCLISKSLSEYGFQAIFSGVIKEMEKRGETRDALIQKIKRYPISQSLKLKMLHQMKTSKTSFAATQTINS